MTEPLVLSEVKEKLASVVSNGYEWPDIPQGWQPGIFFCQLQHGLLLSMLLTFLTQLFFEYRGNKRQ